MSSVRNNFYNYSSKVNITTYYQNIGYPLPKRQKGIFKYNRKIIPIVNLSDCFNKSLLHPWCRYQCSDGNKNGFYLKQMNWFRPDEHFFAFLKMKPMKTLVIVRVYKNSRNKKNRFFQFSVFLIFISSGIFFYTRMRFFLGLEYTTCYDSWHVFFNCPILVRLKGVFIYLKQQLSNSSLDCGPLENWGSHRG